MATRPNSGLIKTDVLIIGAGFSGLILAIELQKQSLGDFILLEKADEIGGTWRDNDYPGAACDVPAHLYSIEQEPNPNWSRMYAPHDEIQAYIKRVATRHAIYDHVHFNQEMQRARWHEEDKRWRVTTAAGEVYEARFLVSAVGGLHIPMIPAFEGLERYAGESFHSSRWNHDYDLGGKRVAVIGTGASSIQFIPEIAPHTAQLDVYQRTPPWIIEKKDYAFSNQVKKLFKAYSPAREAMRKWLFYSHEIRHLVFRGHEPIVRIGEKQALRYLHAHVKDPELREKLTPNYRIGCKRVLRSNNYYQALARENVDLLTSPIARFDEAGITSEDGTHREYDAVIFGTGFRTTTAFDHLDIEGRKGLALQQAWEDGMEANLGTTIHGFPNFFMLLGPNTGLGHNSILLMVEAQVTHVTHILDRVRARGAREFEPTRAAQDAWLEEIHARLADSIWQKGGCQSWYQDANGRNTTLWPGTVAEYQERMKRAGTDGYHIA